MKHREVRCRAVFASFVLTFLAGAVPIRAADDEKPHPNILLITADTTRADHLGPYGYEASPTPSADLMAKLGVVFTRAMSSFPRTTPALATLMTGLWPQHHGSREVGTPFENGATLAEVLSKNGYGTVGVSSNWVASKKQNLHRGFDIFVSMKSRKTDDRGRFVTSRSLKLEQTVADEKPLFLWAHYMDPHFPYNPPDEWKERTPEAPRCQKIMRSVKKQKMRLSVVQGDHRKIGQRTVSDCIERYDAEIAYMDMQIGKLLRGLEEAGRLENVIIVFTADHGESFGEGGLYYEHGTTVHDSVMRVPLIIAAPGVEPGVDEDLIRGEDLMPTILSLAGFPRDAIPATDGADQSWRLRGERRWPWQKGEVIAVAESGSSLLIGTLNQPFEGRRSSKNCVHGPRFSLCTLPKRGTALYDRPQDPKFEKDVSTAHPDDLAVLRGVRERWQIGEARLRMARDKRFKLVERPRLEGGYARALYDLDSDPAEQLDVIARHPKAAAKLAGALNAWSATLPSEAAPEPDEEEMEALRALGYVD